MREGAGLYSALLPGCTYGQKHPWAEAPVWRGEDEADSFTRESQREGRDVDGGDSLERVDDEEQFDHLARLRREASQEGGVVDALDSQVQRVERVATKRRAAVDDLEYEAAESPQVDRRAPIGLVRGELRRHVGRRSAHTPQLAVAARDGEAEIAQLDRLPAAQAIRASGPGT